MSTSKGRATQEIPSDIRGCFGLKFSSWGINQKDEVSNNEQRIKCFYCRYVDPCSRACLVDVVGRMLYGQLSFNGMLGELISKEIENEKNAEQKISPEIREFDGVLKQMGYKKY